MLQSLLHPPPTGCRSTPTEKNMGKYACLIIKFIFKAFWKLILLAHFLLIISTSLPLFRYTGSYNYGSYANQHPHSIQSQYPSLAHEPAIPAPLHYSAYHRSSAQVSLSHLTDRFSSILHKVNQIINLFT